MKKRLTLNSFVFLWIKNNDGLLYNTKNGKSFQFGLTTPIRNICNSLLDYDKLYSVEVDTIIVAEFINHIIEGEFGVLDDIDNVCRISLPPLLNIQNDYNRIKNDAERSIGDGILAYFSTLNIFMGGGAPYDYYRQTLYPHPSTNILSLYDIIELLSDSAATHISHLNIICGVDMSTNLLSDIISYLNAIERKAMFFILYKDKDKISIMKNSNYPTTLLCMAEDNLSEIKEGEFFYRVLVRNDDELERDSHDIIPIFDNNLDFFNKNVFLNREDILGGNLTKRNIFSHQAVNSNFFGVLNVLPDKKIFSNVNCEALGTIGESLSNLILLEMESNIAWRKVRDNAPCSNCLYQWLCPSPSNYEKVIGRMNLCNIV